MTENQYPNHKNRQKLSPGFRWLAGAVFGLIAGGFTVLWLSKSGYINLTRWFGVCGFKQRFDLPCPGCGWTHAAEAFVTGHFWEAFKTQPAATFFCVVLSFVAVFALHNAVFGVKFKFLERFSRSKGVGVLLAIVCIVIVAGWMVNLARTILGN